MIADSIFERFAHSFYLIFYVVVVGVYVCAVNFNLRPESDADITLMVWAAASFVWALFYLMTLLIALISANDR